MASFTDFCKFAEICESLIGANDMGQEKIEAFLTELTALSHRHGVGVKDGALYELELEDGERRYNCDEESRLDFV